MPCHNIIGPGGASICGAAAGARGEAGDTYDNDMLLNICYKRGQYSQFSASGRGAPLISLEPLPPLLPVLRLCFVACAI